MALHRQGRYIRSGSKHVRHYAWERTADRFVVSFWANELFTVESARSALRIAELAAQYGEGLLFSNSPEVRTLWVLIDRLGTEAGIDPFAAVIHALGPVQLPHRKTGRSL